MIFLTDGNTLYPQEAHLHSPKRQLPWSSLLMAMHFIHKKHIFIVPKDSCHDLPYWWMNFSQCNTLYIQKIVSCCVLWQLTCFPEGAPTLNKLCGNETCLWCLLRTIWCHRQYTFACYMVKSTVRCYLTWNKLLPYLLKLPCTRIHSVTSHKILVLTHCD
jgi:hypothetical protein